MIKNIIKLLFGHQLGRFFIIRKLFNFLMFILDKLKISGDIDGLKMYLNSKITIQLFVSANKKLFEKLIFEKQIKEGDTVLDLGANVGYYTLIAAKLVGDNGRVYAFEPDPLNFSYLQKNIKLNGFDNCIMEQKAISDKNENSKFYLNENDFSMHSMYSTEGTKKNIEIETIKLDGYFNNNKVDFIKIDIEGGEYWALQGMRSILESNKNIKIFTEFNPNLLKKSNIKPKEYLDLLEKNNFKLFNIDDKKKELKIITVKELIERYVNGGYTNLICKR